LLKPGHFFVAVLSIIGCLKVFDQVYISVERQGRPGVLHRDGGALSLPDLHRPALGLRGGRRGRPVRDHLRDHPVQRLLFGRAEIGY
jgi:ABC-type sugar transport systems, permease components